jgi:large subunit ribosomal protein L15
MQTKRKKRSRIRADKVTAGHGSKKKNRGAGHRGGRGKAGSGKRGDGKIMKITSGDKYLGKHGFKVNNPLLKTITLQTIQEKLNSYLAQGTALNENGIYKLDLKRLKYDKLLSKGKVNFKLEIKVDIASPQAVKKVESAGGKVILSQQK